MNAQNSSLSVIQIRVWNSPKADRILFGNWNDFATKALVRLADSRKVLLLIQPCVVRENVCTSVTYKVVDILTVNSLV